MTIKRWFKRSGLQFTKQLELLKSQYRDDMIVRKNRTLLLSPGKIPKCRHMLFEPLTDELIEEYLQANYKHRLPDEYVEFLKHFNGANLCYIRAKTDKFTIASCLFTIFALPRTQPFGRPLDEEQPYDIRIEDLGRHDNIPSHWLKCARFFNQGDLHTPYDVFIDTKTGAVFACARNDDKIAFSWSSLDKCFCEILSHVLQTPEEINVTELL